MINGRHVTAYIILILEIIGLAIIAYLIFYKHIL